MLLLVRHAHAGNKRHWQRLDSLRPLSVAGQAEAAGRLVRLEDYPIGRVLSSPTVRCQQTVQPLAWPKGSTWLLEGADRHFAFGRYLPPLRLVDALIRPSAPPANGLAHTGQQGHRPSATLVSKIRDEEV